MSIRGTFIATEVCAALLVVGCSRGAPATPGPSTFTLSSLGSTGRAEIDPSDRPDAPPGFSDRDVYSLAGPMAEIMAASFSKEILAVKGIDAKFSRVMRLLKKHAPEAVPALIKAGDDALGPHPWKRIFVDEFGAESRPTTGATILKVEWDAERDDNGVLPD